MAGGLKISDIINQGKKVVPVKDLHPVVSLEEAQKIIYKNLVTASEGIISNGYYMKLIRDKKLYRDAGFVDVWSWALATYGISKSTASRWMTLNDKYSIEGNSPNIQDRFKGFGKSQLQEMLYLTDAQMEQVEEGMTVKEIREIRKPEAVEDVAEPIVATSQQHESAWFVKRYFDGRTQVLDKIARVFERYEKNIERAKKIQELVSPYGSLGGCGGGLSYDFRGFVKGVDFEDEITRQKIHLSYKELATLIDEIYGPFEYVRPEESAVATSQQEEIDGQMSVADYPKMLPIDEEIHVEQVECEVVDEYGVETETDMERTPVATSQQGAKYTSSLVLSMLMDAKKLYEDMKNVGYEVYEDSMKRQQVRVDALELLYSRYEGGDCHEKD